jgi:hypothetical protein
MHKFYILKVEVHYYDSFSFVNLISDSLDKNENISVAKYYFKNSSFLDENLKSLFLKDEHRFLKDFVIIKIINEASPNARIAPYID